MSQDTIAKINTAYRVGDLTSLTESPCCYFSYLTANPDQSTPYLIENGLRHALQLIDQNSLFGLVFLQAFANGAYNSLFQLFFQGLAQGAYAQGLMTRAKNKHILGLRAQLLTIIAKKRKGSQPIFDPSALIEEGIALPKANPKEKISSRYFYLYRALSDHSSFINTLLNQNPDLVLSKQQREEETLYVFLKNIDQAIKDEQAESFFQTSAFKQDKQNPVAQKSWDLAYSLFIHPLQPHESESIMQPVIERVMINAQNAGILIQKPTFIAHPYQEIDAFSDHKGVNPRSETAQNNSSLPPVKH